MNRTKIGKIVSTAAFPAIIAAIVVVVVIFRRELGQVFSSTDNLQKWIDNWGVWGPLVFIGIQIFQVVIFIVPGEVAQIAGGYLFGVWAGLFYSIVGIVAGSAVNFFLARSLGTQFVEGLFKKQQVEKFESLISSDRAMVGFFLFFVIPGIPKDILCYVAGLSRMSFLSFLAISMLGRMPGVLGSAIIGNSAADKNWLVTGIITGVAVILFVAGLILRTRIHALIERIAGRKGAAGDVADSEAPRGDEADKAKAGTSKGEMES